MHKSRIEDAFEAQTWKADRTVEQQCDTEPTKKRQRRPPEKSKETLRLSQARSNDLVFS